MRSHLVCPRPAVLSVILLVAAILIPAHAQGYSTGRHWQGSNYTLAIRVDQADASQLGLSGRQTEINQNIGSALAKWNNASWWTYYNDTAQTCTQGSSGCVSVLLLPDRVLAYTYWDPPSGTVITGAHINLSTRYSWHINDGQEPDIFKVSLHELGHVIGLQDGPSYTWGGSAQSVMWYSNNNSGLYIDDKEAISLMYGPWTQFEVDQFLGLYQAPPFYAEGVSSFDSCGTGYPDYWTYDPGSVGIPYSPNGGRVMQFRGCADYNGSLPNYAYMPFATSSQDSPTNPQQGSVPQCGDPCYLKITSGMHLTWEQYNALQCKVTVDLEFSDGTTLRDSGLLDTEGHSVHPQNRPCYLGWHTVTIDLSPLAGKTIRRILLAYDNPSGFTKWRSYFDDLYISY